MHYIKLLQKILSKTKVKLGFPPPFKKKWGQSWITPTPDSVMPDAKNETAWERVTSEHSALHTDLSAKNQPAFLKHKLPKIFIQPAKNI